MHKVRESWRWKNWEKFEGTERRDARMLREVQYHETRVKLARAMAKGQTRRVHLMTGAFKSPKIAEIAGRGEKFQDCICIWPGCREGVTKTT